jgi:hypothetical protein
MNTPIKLDALKRDAKKARKADPTLTHAQHLNRLSRGRHGARDFHDLHNRVAVAWTKRIQQLPNANIRKVVDQLIALDRERQTLDAEFPTFVSFGAVSKEQQKVADDLVWQILSGPKNDVISTLKEVPDDTLAHVVALALYGRGHGADTFEEELDDAREFLRSDGRDRVVGYISAKPLARYLTAGLKRIDDSKA